MRPHSGLVLGFMFLTVVVGLKRPNLSSVSRRGQERARNLVQDVAHDRLTARHANTNSSSSVESRYLNAATESRSFFSTLLARD